ncbi:MAG: thiol reductant ABC exporter subunit CydD [Anaerolineales bacterium]
MNLDKRLLDLLQNPQERVLSKNKTLLFLSIGLGFLAALTIVAQAWVLSQVVNSVFLENSSLSGEITPLISLLIIFALRAGFTWGSEFSSSTMAIRIKSKLRCSLFEHILNLGPSYTNQQRSGELSSVCMDGVESVEDYFREYLPGLVLAALIPIVYLVIIFPLDSLTGFVLLFTAPLIPIFMVLIGDRSAALTRRQWTILSSMSAYFLDVIQGLKTLKALGQSENQSDVIERVSDQFRRATMNVLRVAFLSALTLELVATISIAIVAVEIGLRLLAGSFSYRNALFLLMLAPEFYLPLRSLGARFHAGMDGLAASKRIFEILNQPVQNEVETSESARNQTNFNRPYSFNQIRFSQVSLVFPDGRRALNRVNFEISQGQKIALVGSSGAGKTTIAELLLRFIDPSSGAVTLDGIPLPEIPRQILPGSISWVPQKPFLFNDTVRSNIGLGKPDASSEQIENAARKAHAHQFIKRLPSGYDTIVGEGGTRLSAGQAQRLVLARAFLKDSPIVILDEATSNLDPRTEKELEESFERLLSNRTALIIAHRLVTIQNADKIFLVENGEAREISSIDYPYYTTIARKSQAHLFPASSPITLEARLVSQANKEKEVPEDRNQKSPAPLPVLPIPASKPDQTFLLNPPGPKTGAEAVLRLIRLISPHKWIVLLSIMVGFLTVASGIGLMAASCFIISAAALQNSIADLQVAIVAVRAFGISRGAFRYLERYLSHQTTFQLLARFRVWFYDALEPLAPARTTGYRSGDLLTRIQNDIQSLDSFYVRALAPPLTAVLVTAGMSIALYIVSPSLGITIFAFMVSTGLLLPAFLRSVGRKPGRELVLTRSGINELVVDGISGIADLLVYQAGLRWLNQVRDSSRKLARTQLTMAGLNCFLSSMVMTLANLCMWSILVLSIPLVDSGQLNGVYLAAILLASLTAFEALLPLSLSAQYLEANILSATRLFEIVDQEPEVHQPAHPAAVPTEFKLQISNLTFRYPEQPDLYSKSKILFEPAATAGDVLADITFSLKPRRRIAIVGPSGGGKSTLVDLLLRFWEYDRSCHICLDGREIRAFNLAELRRNLGVALQNDYLFNASLRDNLLVARPSASQKDIEKAANLAQLTGFINALPAGFDTQVGERGLSLSAGENQRLSLGRVFLSKAPLIILDEPTSNLDMVTQSKVFQAIREFTRDRSLILVTHWLLELDWLDQILVLDRGKIIQRGTESELLASDGIFNLMWTIQSRYL